jgi:hypothetical protein
LGLYSFETLACLNGLESGSKPLSIPKLFDDLAS